MEDRSSSMAPPFSIVRTLTSGQGRSGKNPVQVLLKRRQGLLEGGERPERDLVHDVRRTLVRLDHEPGPARSNDASQGTAEGPVAKFLGFTGR